MAQTVELPAEVVQLLLQLAEHLPTKARPTFLQRAADALGSIAWEYRHTMTSAAIGFLLGALLDAVLTIHVPFTTYQLVLTGSRGKLLGLAGGALFGLLRDMNHHDLLSLAARRLAVELQSALASK